ncbi:MAG: DUF4097 family beta strand repeat-containing protein [Acidobacteriota bacterium]
MLRQAPRWILLCVAALAMLNVSCTYDIEAGVSGPVATESRTLERTFPADVRLANLAGTVEIVEGSGSEVRVTAEIHAKGDSDSETQELLEGMDWIEYRTKKGVDLWALSYPVDEHRKFSYPRKGMGLLRYGSSSSYYLGKKVTVTRKPSGAPVLYAHLTIEVPSGADVGMRNLVGGIEVESLQASHDLDTGSGDVTLADLEGDLMVDTGSGNVSTGSVDGDVGIDTGSGDVEIAAVRGGELEVDTGSGNVQVSSGRVRSVMIDTGSGNIRVEDFDAEEMDFDTGSGNITVDSPLDWARKVVADTGSGNVTILGDAEASFKIRSDQGSGNLTIGYRDAELIKSGRELVGAERGDQHTRIDVDTGSGNVRLSPR